MSVLGTVQRSIAQAVVLLGDAINPVLVAAAIAFDPIPGEDYAPTWAIHTGQGFFEVTESKDFPNSEVQQTDRTLVLLQCDHDVDEHEFVKVGDDVYHVYGVKADVVGTTRVLQKLLVRPEQKTGIAWDSLDQTAA